MKYSHRHLKIVTSALFCAVALGVNPAAAAQLPNLAPGFTEAPKNAKIVIMPTDIELFALTAGGVNEPRADWTAAASKHFRDALIKKKQLREVKQVDLSTEDADALSEVNSLHAAIAGAISFHHFTAPNFRLPTKNGQMDWSMGEPVSLIKQRTGADYALFSFVRDSYATAERKATMILLAAVGVGITLGQQVGYASLVDLNTGQVVWFNQMFRISGDLRDADSAKVTLDLLLQGLPVGPPASHIPEPNEVNSRVIER